MVCKIVGLNRGQSVCGGWAGSSKFNRRGPNKHLMGGGGAGKALKLLQILGGDSILCFRITFQSPQPR